MRKIMLSGVSALALLAMAGGVAAQTTPGANPPVDTQMQTAPAPATSGAMPQAAPAAQAPGAMTGGMAADKAGDEGQFRSYSGMEKGSFQGTVSGGYSAEQLIGRDVVGPDGEEIAEIADLIVEPDNTVKKVIVDVGGFLGVGAKPVALDIDQLQKGADADDELRTSMTKEQLEALPRYERNNQGFYVPRTEG